MRYTSFKLTKTALVCLSAIFIPRVGGENIQLFTPFSPSVDAQLSLASLPLHLCLARYTFNDEVSPNAERSAEFGANGFLLAA